MGCNFPIDLHVQAEDSWQCLGYAEIKKGLLIIFSGKLLAIQKIFPPAIVWHVQKQNLGILSFILFNILWLIWVIFTNLPHFLQQAGNSSWPLHIRKKKKSAVKYCSKYVYYVLENSNTIVCLFQKDGKWYI